MSTVQIPDMLTTTNKKEKVNMILEPLQVMLTLSMLSFCPVGTKIYISNNVLYVHEPSMLQGVYRWLDGNSKDDLYYLFHAIRRYYKWYKSENTKVFSFILEQAIKGLENLMITYEKSEQTSIIHTLKLYKNVLGMEAPDHSLSEQIPEPRER